MSRFSRAFQDDYYPPGCDGLPKADPDWEEEEERELDLMDVIFDQERDER